MSEFTEQFDALLMLRHGHDTGHGIRLVGDIYGDKLTSGQHPFADGTLVNTSPLVSIDGQVFITTSGTRYRIIFEAPLACGEQADG